MGDEAWIRDQIFLLTHITARPDRFLKPVRSNSKTLRPS